MSPLLAQSGHFAAESECPLFGVKRTFAQECIRQTGKSLRLDIRELNYLPKLLDFAGNEFAELGGRACKSLPA